MSKKVGIIVIVFIIIGLIGFAAYKYVMHGGERNLSSENTDFEVSSKNITAEFTANIEAANKKYLEKAVAITGTVTAISGSEVTLDKTIVCTLKISDPLIKIDQKVTVKGRVVGYDDLMGELKLDQCFVIKN